MSNPCRLSQQEVEYDYGEECAACGYKSIEHAINNPINNPTQDPHGDDEQVARLFHDTYERLAPQLGYETREDTKAFDPTTPNGKLMMAVCNEVVVAHKLQWQLEALQSVLVPLSQFETSKSQNIKAVETANNVQDRIAELETKLKENT